MLMRISQFIKHSSTSLAPVKLPISVSNLFYHKFISKYFCTALCQTFSPVKSKRILFCKAFNRIYILLSSSLKGLPEPFLLPPLTVFSSIFLGNVSPNSSWHICCFNIMVNQKVKGLVISHSNTCIILDPVSNLIYVLINVNSNSFLMLSSAAIHIGLLI